LYIVLRSLYDVTIQRENIVNDEKVGAENLRGTELDIDGRTIVNGFI
jgi:hypothetical protein